MKLTTGNDGYSAGKQLLLAIAVGVGTTGVVGAAELTIESWRNDDLTIWQDMIIPAFEAKHPDIKGNQRPMGSRHHGLPEHRSKLLEG